MKSFLLPANVLGLLLTGQAAKAAEPANLEEYTDKLDQEMRNRALGQLEASSQDISKDGPGKLDEFIAQYDDFLKLEGLSEEQKAQLIKARDAVAKIKPGLEEAQQIHQALYGMGDLAGSLKKAGNDIIGYEALARDARRRIRKNLEELQAIQHRLRQNLPFLDVENLFAFNPNAMIDSLVYGDTKQLLASIRPQGYLVKTSQNDHEVMVSYKPAHTFPLPQSFQNVIDDGATLEQAIDFYRESRGETMLTQAVHLLARMPQKSLHVVVPGQPSPSLDQNLLQYVLEHPGRGKEHAPGVVVHTLSEKEGNAVRWNIHYKPLLQDMQVAAKLAQMYRQKK